MDPKCREGMIESKTEKPIPQFRMGELDAESGRAGPVVISLLLVAEVNFAFNKCVSFSLIKLQDRAK